MSLLGDGNGLFWFAPRHQIFAVPVLKTPHAERRGILWSYYATWPHVSNDVSCFADMCLGWRSSLTVSRVLLRTTEDGSPFTRRYHGIGMAPILERLKVPLFLSKLKAPRVNLADCRFDFFLN